MSITMFPSSPTKWSIVTPAVYPAMVAHVAVGSESEMVAPMAKPRSDSNSGDEVYPIPLQSNVSYNVPFLPY